jgi:Lrp/AsnC family transcriptional regulator, leucine-responsive regulatory protein
MLSMIALDETDRRILNALQQDCALTNQELAKRVHVSAPTCLRRVRRLLDQGVIERQIAIVSPEALATGLTAIVEVTLERQSAELLEQFERQLADDAAVQQCYRVSAGPDFVLVVYVADMAAYHAFVHRVLSAHANVRNVRSFFSVRRSKFAPSIPA